MAVALALHMLGCTSVRTAVVSESASCARTFSDAQIGALVVSNIAGWTPAKIDINWTQCRYYVVAWPPGFAPDAQLILVFDAKGTLIEGPR